MNIQFIIILLSSCVDLSRSVVRELYIASEEIAWDYRGSDNLDTRSDQRRQLNSRDGSELYVKAIYREYTDATFSTLKARPSSNGIQGPTIRAEVNDKVVVHFKNFASQSYSINPIGISYWKQSEGVGYDDATSAQEKEDDAVVSGGYYRYVWDILPADGPTTTDPDCLTYSYSSQVDVVRDVNSGLIGAFLICKAGSLTSDGHQKIPEYILLFAVFDESRSWYGESGMSLERFQKTRQKKLYHTINGYVNSTLPGLKICQKSNVFWHLIGMGSSSEIHSIYFQKHTLQVKNHRKVFLEMTPMTFVTAEMKPVGVGNYMISCQIHSHQLAGMNAQFTVEDCPEAAQISKKSNFIQSDDYEYDISLEGLVSPILINSGLTPRSAVKLKPKTWVHYIAAEEIVWDYAPELSEADRNSDYTVRAPQRIGKEYKKAAYVEYTDASFRQQKPPNGSLLGPVLRGEVDDKIKIVFKNLASVPFNIYPNGLTSISPFGSRANVIDLRNYPVMPNDTFVYIWRITADDGPTKADPRCLTRLYKSTINPVRDLAAGLVGPLVVCYRKTLDKRGNVLMSDKEKHLMFTVFDENQSWYIDDNIQKYVQDPSKVDPADPDFYRSNVMYNVNGLMFNNLNFVTCLGDVTFWHVLNVGTQSDFLSVYFMGNTFERDKVYETVLTLFPMNGETVSMEMETVGEWEIGAFDPSAKNRGMSAKYTVKDCDRNHPLFDDSDYLEEYIQQNIGRSAGRKNRTLAVRLCRKPIDKNTSTSARKNTTEDSHIHPFCEITYISLSPNGQSEVEGDIPEDVLREVLRQKHPVILQSGNENHLPLDSMGTHHKFTPEPSKAPGKLKKRTLSDPIFGGALTDVPITTPSETEDEDRSVESPILDTAPPLFKEKDTQPLNEDHTSSEDLNMGSGFNKQLNRSEAASSTDHVEHKNNHTILVRSAIDTELRNRQRGSGPLRMERGVEDIASRKMMTKAQQKAMLEEKNLIPEQDDIIEDDGVEDPTKDLDEVFSALHPSANTSNSRNITRSDSFFEYDDYTTEKDELNEINSLGLRATDGKYRNYYIAAVEVMWDYGLKKRHQVMKARDMLRAKRMYLPEYKKVVFRAYLDQDFRYPAPRGELEEHLGIMGPVIKTEINDVLIVTFKNLASKPFSFHLHGIFEKGQGEENEETNAEAVQPNEVRVYRRKITKRQGPSSKEFDCKSWAYYSNLNMERDVNSGLIGPLIVCKPNTLHPIDNIDLNVQEFHLLFTIFDETKSWYFEENINRFCPPPCSLRRNDPWFESGNKFSAINGYTAETLPGLLVTQHQRIRWHLLNMGGSGELHAVHFHGLPFTVRSDQEHRMGIYSLYPGVFGTVEMRPVMAGTWMAECSIGEHQLSGMRAKLLVYSPQCIEPLGMRTGRISDSQITDSGHYGDWEARLARLELAGSVNAWSGINRMSWIQVDLKRPMLVHKIRTQGATHGLSESFIVMYNVSYSQDSVTWKTYKGKSTKPTMIFTGNIDGSRIKENFFSPPILGRYIRVHPIEYNKRPTLRMELYGCDLNSCSMPMGMEKMQIPNHSISASSFLHKLFLSWSPSLARLNLDGAANAWRPKTNNPYEWIQVDFMRVKKVTGVVTQGARSFLTHMMVTEFTVSVSNNGRVWTSVLEEDTKMEKVFQGNDRYDEEALNVFEPPLFTRYIRIQPRGWYNEIALRLEFLGCDTQE
ncbi:coagulation factor VIII isoform X2 [Brienomyrus brachyistius]|uniref:coagulation factor VIII isoform X2 n=1 Tax=Brienomyrus brachyistius TaxID=42636 RepID=UPI0020B34BC9|nr:coagulation factor VIII isoform X2 [Brienomyrus brachyistius]